MIFFSESAETAEDTEALGRRVAELLAPALATANHALVLCLNGEMGVGKTTFTRGVASYFGANRVKSPTYTVVNEYPSVPPIYHFDFYRLSGEDDLAGIGYDDYLTLPGIVIIEWSEIVPEAIPNDAYTVELTRMDDGSRRITFALTSEKE